MERALGCKQPWDGRIPGTEEFWGRASVQEQGSDLAKSRRKGIAGRKKMYEIVKGKKAEAGRQNQ